MPQYFKAMATVGMWGLYIAAWWVAALTFIKGGIIEGYALGIAEAPTSYYISYAVCIGFSIAGGFMMLVRKHLE